VLVTGVVRLIIFESWKFPEGSQACFDACFEGCFGAGGSPRIDTSFSYPGLPILELILPVTEMV
jgi:hypothetical protein